MTGNVQEKWWLASRNSLHRQFDALINDLNYCTLPLLLVSVNKAMYTGVVGKTKSSFPVLWVNGVFILPGLHKSVEGGFYTVPEFQS